MRQPDFPKLYSLRASEEVCPKHRNVHRERPVAARQSCPVMVFVLCCNRQGLEAINDLQAFYFRGCNSTAECLSAREVLADGHPSGCNPRQPLFQMQKCESGI